MPIARCIDCGKGRRHVAHGGSIPKRCKSCARLHRLDLQKSKYDERRRKKLCAWCGDPLSAHSIFFCVACGSYHAGYQARLMREKRAKSPAYREDEREKVRARMRTIRAERRKAGITGNGTPYKSQATADRYGLLAS
jgi:hypothetical protein